MTLVMYNEERDIMGLYCDGGLLTVQVIGFWMETGCSLHCFNLQECFDRGWIVIGELELY